MKPLLPAVVIACSSMLAPAVAFADIATLDDASVRKSLLGLPQDGHRSATVVLPVDASSTSLFNMRDSGTLPPALARKFPGMRSFRGTDAKGRTVRLDLSAGGLRASVRDGAAEWVIRPGSATMERAPDRTIDAPEPVLAAVRSAAPDTRRLARGGGNVRYDFRLAVAAGSRYAAAFGGTVEATLGAIVHAVNRANEVFETDVGVHFTLVPNNDRLIRVDARADPFLRMDPGPASVQLIEREIGKRHYDIGHAVLDYRGGESHVGTSCSDDRSADFEATHKAAAWSGYADPATSSLADDYLIHVLARQIGAWPTANGCLRFTLDDRAVEPGTGSTAMGYAPAGCGGADQWLQDRSDLYFHAASIEQMHDWLASRGGRCAGKRLNPSATPWIDPETLAETPVIPARTPFRLHATVEASIPERRLTYAWEQMDVGATQKHALVDYGTGPLFRSFPPGSSPERVFPRMSAVLGHESAEPGETLPTMSRTLTFRMTVRDNGGDGSTVTGADTRVRTIDTGHAFAVFAPDNTTRIIAGQPVVVRWDVAGTTEAPISCHFVDIDLSADGGATWLADVAAIDERNDGEATVPLPPDIAPGARLRVRVRCATNVFFAVSPSEALVHANEAAH